jgi:hypothetical protein
LAAASALTLFLEGVTKQRLEEDVLVESMFALFASESRFMDHEE